MHLRVPVLRNDHQGMEEKRAEGYAEENIQIVYVHTEKLKDKSALGNKREFPYIHIQNP